MKFRNILLSFLIISLVSTKSSAQIDERKIDQAMTALLKINHDSDYQDAALLMGISGGLGSIYLLLKADDFSLKSVKMIRQFSIRQRYMMITNPMDGLTQDLNRIYRKLPFQFFENAAWKYADVFGMDMEIDEFFRKIPDAKITIASYKTYLPEARKVFKKEMGEGNLEKLYKLINQSARRLLSDSEFQEFKSLETLSRTTFQKLMKSNSVESNSFRMAVSLGRDIQEIFLKPKIRKSLNRYVITKKNFGERQLELLLDDARTGRSSLISRLYRAEVTEALEKVKTLKIKGYGLGLVSLAIILGVAILDSLDDSPELQSLIEKNVLNMDTVQIREELKNHPKDVDLILENLM